MVKISIIVPIYNAEKYLSRCLTSISEQTFSDFELLCINDGSTDNSLLILDMFKKNDPRVKVFNQKNGGPSKARNLGLSNTKGEYITFIDADDIVHPKYLEILLLNANKNTISKCCSFNFYEKKYDFIEKNNLLLNNPIKNQTHNAFDYYISTPDINLSTWGKLIHKSIIDDNIFNDKCYFAEDVLFFSYIFKKNIIIKELHIPLYAYTNNPESLVHQKSSLKKALSLLLVTEHLAENFNNKIAYKNRTSKALSNTLKSLKNCEKSSEIAHAKIKQLYKNKAISYKYLSFKRKLLLFNILRKQ